VICLQPESAGPGFIITTDEVDCQATLTLPSHPYSEDNNEFEYDSSTRRRKPTIGDRFLDYVERKLTRPIKIRGKELEFAFIKHIGSEENEILRRLPWNSPETEERRRGLLSTLDAEISISDVNCFQLS
jgi:hypothetical protein